jgi:hypothetical protein
VVLDLDILEMTGREMVTIGIFCHRIVQINFSFIKYCLYNAKLASSTFES